MVIQKHLASTVVDRKPPGAIRLIAGADAAYSAEGQKCIAAAVLWDLGAGAVVEERTAVRDLRFPYVPGLLSFREAPAVMAALRKLSRRPDALILDGHGWAHPRHFGLACHVGVLCGLPTLGCAKSRLIGTYREPGWMRGSRASLKHREQIIGTVLRTRDHVKPVYVSVGHRIDLTTAEKLVLQCTRRFRLPEPTRLADRLVAKAKRQY